LPFSKCGPSVWPWANARIGFKSYADIHDCCCFAWDKRIEVPWKIMPVGKREGAYRP
jgi:hypothetical protein